MGAKHRDWFDIKAKWQKWSRASNGWLLRFCVQSSQCATVARRDFIIELFHLFLRHVDGRALFLCALATFQTIFGRQCLLAKCVDYYATCESNWNWQSGSMCRAGDDAAGGMFAIYFLHCPAIGDLSMADNFYTKEFVF